MMGFTKLGRAEVEGCADVAHYKSTTTSMQVIISKVPSPLISAQIIIPTKAESSKGEPHCLEHLAFRGSRLYPVAGYLDALASANLAEGTNAYTCTDRTVYTVETASAEGLANILPAYLDHVHFPTLSDTDFQTEVFHIDENGDNAGVVYSEMEQAMSGVEDFVLTELAKVAYAGCSYMHNTGGDPVDLAHLTNAEVKMMHEKYYRPSNTVVTVVGNVSDEEVLEIIASYEKTLPDSVAESSQEFVSPWWSMVEEPLVPSSTTLNCAYAGSREDEENGDGTVAFGFRQGLWSNTEERVALECLCTYLTEGAGAPITQHLIENPETSLAANVCFAMEPFRWMLVSLLFNDVDKDQLPSLKDALMKIFNDLVYDKKSFDVEVMRKYIRKKSWEERDSLETAPQQHLETRLPSWVVNCRPKEQTSLRNLICEDKVYCELLLKDSAWWRNFIKTSFLDRPCYQVVALPSASKLREKEHEKELLRLKRKEMGVIPTKSVGLTPVEEAARKNQLQEMMIKAGKCVRIAEKTKAMTGGVFTGPTLPNEYKKFKTPVQIVDLDLCFDEHSAPFRSEFIDLSVLVETPTELKEQTIWEFLTVKGYEGKKNKTRLDAFDQDIKESLLQLPTLDFEKQWKEKQEKIAKELADQGEANPADVKMPDSLLTGQVSEDEADKEKDDDSSMSDDDESGEDIDDFCWRALWFVLQHLTPAHLLPVIAHNVFTSDLFMPKKEAKKLNLTMSHIEGSEAQIENKDLFIALSSVAMEFEAEQGLGSSEVFNDLMLITWKCHVDSFGSSLKLLRACLEYLDFSVERLSANVKKDLTQFNSDFRSGKNITTQLDSLQKYETDAPINVNNTLIQKVLGRVILKWPEVFEQLLCFVWDVYLDQIVSGTTRLHISGSLEPIKKNAEQIRRAFPEWQSTRLQTPRSARTHMKYERRKTVDNGYNAECKQVSRTALGFQYMNFHSVVTYADTIDSGRVSLAVKIPETVLQVNPESFSYYLDHAPLLVVQHYLDCLDGPIFQPVRDSGAAYGAGFRLALDNAETRLVLMTATKPAHALEVAVTSLKQVLHDAKQLRFGTTQSDEKHGSLLSEIQFQQAQGAALYAVIQEMSSPSSAGDCMLDIWLRRLPKNYDVDLLKKIEAVSFDQFLEVLIITLETLLEKPGATFAAIGPLSKTQELVSKLPTLLQNSELANTDERKHSLEEVYRHVVNCLTRYVPKSSSRDKDSDFLKQSLLELLRARLSSLSDLADGFDSDEDDEDYDDDTENESD